MEMADEGIKNFYTREKNFFFQFWSEKNDFPEKSIYRIFSFERHCESHFFIRKQSFVVKKYFCDIFSRNTVFFAFLG